MFRFEVPASVSIGSVGVGNEVDAVFGVCQEPFKWDYADRTQRSPNKTERNRTT